MLRFEHASERSLQELACARPCRVGLEMESYERGINVQAHRQRLHVQVGKVCKLYAIKLLRLSDELPTSALLPYERSGVWHRMSGVWL